MAQQTTLPFFKQKRAPSNSLNIPRRYELSVSLLRALSTLPALWNALQNIRQTWAIAYRDAGGAVQLDTSPIEHDVALLWCLLAAYWSWHLTTGFMQQWLYRLEIKQAITRLTGLIVTIASISVFTSLICTDPIIAPILTCTILLLIHWMQIRQTTQHHQKSDDPQPVRLLLPLLVVMGLSAFLLSGKIQHDPYRLVQLMDPHQFELDHVIQPSPVIILILSSWSSDAAERRHLLRQTILHWLPSDAQYRFVLGQPPNKQATYLGESLLEESRQFHDLLIVPAPDTHASQKVFEALRWTQQVNYDYLIKTEDDVFVRWDTVYNELKHPQEAYWRGFVYRQMPVDRSLAVDYQMPLLPNYTWGKFYVLSRDVVQMATYTEHPHRWIEPDDINLALWLFGFDLTPVHDARIQTVDTCEQDVLAKQLSLTDFSHQLNTLYTNVKSDQMVCKGLELGNHCALCYSCHGRSDDWRSQQLECDPLQGVSPTPSVYPKIPQSSHVKDVLSNNSDTWIIPHVLSTKTSIYSNETHWHLLYWVCWTSDPSTFTDRHWRALEMVWIHEPDAAIFMISNTLTQSFFDDYTQRGYRIQVVHFNQQNLLHWGWYFGPGTQDWLEAWDQWEQGKFFYWHLTDYIRCLLLYNYGGTYMDMDALWIRVPPDPQLEFIGSDYSQVHSDRAWTLDQDGLYLPQGLMRFKRGWKLFREMAEAAFSAYHYDPECFNCGGPKAITSYVRQRRGVLEEAGLTILPRHILYPYNYLEIHQLLEPNPLADQELKTRLEQESWNIHLFGKMTNHLPVQPQSMIDRVFSRFDLDLPHPDTQSHQIISSTGTRQVPMRLIAPVDYLYQAISPRMQHDYHDQLRFRSVPGRFQGLHVIYVRGGPDRIAQVTIQVESAIGRVRLEQEVGKRVAWTGQDVTMQQVNHVLQTLQFLPTRLMLANGGRDRVKVSVRYEHEREELKEAQISLTVMEPTEEDDMFDEEVF